MTEEAYPVPSKVLPSGRRSHKVLPIPEDVQSSMRKRLKMLRESRDLRRSELRTLTNHSVLKLERDDISPFRLGDMYGMALEYGLSLEEFIVFIVGEEQAENVTPHMQRVRRMNVLLNTLDDNLAEAAVDIVQRLMVHSVDDRKRDNDENKTDERLSSAPRRDARQTAREMVRQANIERSDE